MKDAEYLSLAKFNKEGRQGDLAQSESAVSMSLPLKFTCGMKGTTKKSLLYS